MTGKEFLQKMSENEGGECGHKEADGLLCEALRFFSQFSSASDEWEQGIVAYEKLSKWYA